MPNPSELHRLEEELRYWRDYVLDFNLSKTTREAALGELRKVERKLGMNGKDYNSSDFSSG